MSRAFRNTLTMVAVAAMTSVAAAVYYPWPMPEAAQRRPDQPLFPDYRSAQVRGIEIVGMDRTESALQRLTIRLVGGQWVIPDKGNYPAGNAARIAAALAAMTDLQVLDTVSSDQTDHELYGVLHPDEAQGSAGGGIGRVITLEDRNRVGIASLIVGRTQGDDPRKRFVRLPGQPHIYVADLDANILSTDFPDWIHPDLFRIPWDRQQSPLERLREITINHYLIDAQTFAEGAPAQHNYRATMRAGEQSQWSLSMWNANEQGQLADQPIEGTAPAAVLDIWQRIMVAVPVVDVIRKDGTMAAALANPQPTDRPAVFRPAQSAGFRYDGFHEGRHRFQSMAGQASVTTVDGIRFVIYFGGLAGVDPNASAQFRRAIMIVAEVDNEAIDQRFAGGGDQQATETEPVGAGQTREQMLAAATHQVRELNQIFSLWFYIVPDQMVQILRPDAEQLRPE